MMKKRFSTSRSATTLTTDDDVDDDTFLSASKGFSRPLSPYGKTGEFSNEPLCPITLQHQLNSLEDHRTQLINSRKEIEGRTLESTQRSLSLLRDSEDVGIATADELHRQREQLENTDSRLNEINENLHSSNKHIQGISSIFGSIKNYWSSRKSTEDKEKEVLRPPPHRSPRSVSMDATPRSRRQLHSALEHASTNLDADDHPVMRVRGVSSMQSKSSTDSSDFENALDRNLDEMVMSLGKLKGLAQGLGQELDSQNQLLEDVITKTEKADINIEKQNKDIKRLLRK